MDAIKQESLIGKIKEGDKDAVVKLLKSGADPNELITIDGITFTALDVAMQIALNDKNYSILDILVDYGANCTGVSQLCIYCKMRGFYRKHSSSLNFGDKFKKAFDENEGLCVGFSRLYFYLKMQELKQQVVVCDFADGIFQSSLEKIVGWSKDNDNAEDFNDIMSFIYYVTFFQSPFDFYNIPIESSNFKAIFDSASFFLEEEVGDFVKQYNIVLTKVEELEKMLKCDSFRKKHIFLSLVCSDNLDIGHEVCLYIDEAAKVQYYDSNSPYGVKQYDSVEEFLGDFKQYHFALYSYEAIIFTVYDFNSIDDNVVNYQYPDKSAILTKIDRFNNVDVIFCALEFSAYSGCFVSIQNYASILDEVEKVCSDPNSLIYRAAATGGTEGLRYLFAMSGADVNKDFANGITSLMVASFYNNESAVVMLIVYGANINAMTLDKKTALVYAIENKAKAVIRILFDKLEQSNLQEFKDHAILICRKVSFRNHYEVFSDSVDNAYERLMGLLPEEMRIVPNHLLVGS